MLGLTTLGTIHTAISLVAVVTGFWALARDREIVPANRLGQTYLVTTFLTAATGLGIFQHGGFGAPHALSILTLLAIAVGTVAATSGLFGGASRYIQVISYSSTVFFHLIPGFTETLTRLPLGAPLVASPREPVLQWIIGACFLIFLVGLAFQLRWVRSSRPTRTGSQIDAARYAKG